VIEATRFNATRAAGAGTSGQTAAAADEAGASQRGN
jgi:hypothetical protein